MPPKWLTPVAAAAFLTGLAALVVGPMLFYAIGAARLDALPADEQPLDEQARQEVLQAEIKEVWEAFAWVVPVCGAMGFMGAIGLLLAWVSRPLGDDLQRAADDPATGERTSGLD